MTWPKPVRSSGNAFRANREVTERLTQGMNNTRGTFPIENWIIKEVICGSDEFPAEAEAIKELYHYTFVLQKLGDPTGDTYRVPAGDTASALQGHLCGLTEDDFIGKICKTESLVPGLRGVEYGRAYIDPGRDGDITGSKEGGSKIGEKMLESISFSFGALAGQMMDQIEEIMEFMKK